LGAGTLVTEETPKKSKGKKEKESIKGKEIPKGFLRPNERKGKERKEIPKAPQKKEEKKPDYFKLGELPRDVQMETALNLSYEDLLNLCKTNTKLAGICKNNDFWRRKILKDFRDKVDQQDLEKLKPEQFRAKYEDLYADKLDQESRQYFYNKYQEDKEWKKYENEIDNINDKIDALREQIERFQIRQRDIQREQKHIVNRYRDIGDKLREKAEELRKKNIKILPAEYEHRYFDIRIIPEAVEDLLLEVENEIHTPEDLANYLLEQGLVNKKYKFKRGHLIGITNSNRNRNEAPDAFLYITIRDGRSFIVENTGENEEPITYYPFILVREMAEQGYKIKDIKAAYDLPFDARQIEQNTREYEEEKEEEANEEGTEIDFRYFEVPASEDEINQIIGEINKRKGDRIIHNINTFITDTFDDEVSEDIQENLLEQGFRPGDLIGFAKIEKGNKIIKNAIPELMFYTFNDRGGNGYVPLINIQTSEDLNRMPGFGYLENDLENKGFSLDTFTDAFPVSFKLKENEEESRTDVDSENE
jgi:hypothetical protein